MQSKDNSVENTGLAMCCVKDGRLKKIHLYFWKIVLITHTPFQLEIWKLSKVCESHIHSGTGETVGPSKPGLQR